MLEFGGYWNTEIAGPGKKSDCRKLPDLLIPPNLKFSKEELTLAGKLAILCKRFQKTLT